MNKLNLKFDNAHLGNIDEYIEGKLYNEKNKLVKIKLKSNDGITLNVLKYKTPFIFMLNEMKKHFRCIHKVEYNIATINDIDYLLYEDYDNISLANYIEKSDYKKRLSAELEIQMLFAFNWLMCVNNNYENRINVFTYTNFYKCLDIYKTNKVYFQSVGEKSYNKNFKYDISKFILNKYFNGSMENFNKIVSILISEIDPNKVKFEMEKVVKKYDESYMWWVNIVYEKLLSLI